MKFNILINYLLSASLVLTSSSAIAQVAQQQPTGWVQQADNLVKNATKTFLDSKKLASEKRHYKNQQQMYGAKTPEVSKYFPNQCVVGTGNPNIPTQVCNPEGPGPNKEREAHTFKEISKQNIAFLESLLKTGKEGAMPQGIQCLEDASKVELAKINNTINSLKIEADTIKKQLQQFKDQSKTLLTSMEAVHAELYGPGRRGSLDNKVKDFAKDFSPACRSILGTGALRLANRGGLQSLKDSNLAKYDMANKVRNNSELWKKELQDKISKVRSGINKYGVEVVFQKLENFLGRNSHNINDAVKASMEDEENEFNNLYKATIKQLQDLGMKNDELPKLDQNFNANIGELSKNAKQEFTKHYVNKCALGGKYKVTVDQSDIVQNLTQKGVSRSSTNVITYRRRLNAILAKGGYIEDKIAEIHKLDQEYGNNVKVSYSGGYGKKKRATPSSLYSDIIIQCRKNIENTNEKGGGTLASKIDRAQQYINDMKRASNNFAEQIGDRIYNQVAMCEDNPLPSGSCNEETMNPEKSKGNFCIKNAETCSKSVRLCHGEVEKRIETKVSQLKQMGMQWNQALAAMIAKQKVHLEKNILPIVGQSMGMIQKYMPEATWNYKPDTFVKLPDLKKHRQFGILMRGGGSIADLQKLPEIINTNIVGMLQEQQQKLSTEYSKYIDNKRVAIKDSLNKWENIKDNCSNLSKGIRQQKTKYAQEKQKHVAQKNKELGDFCTKYDYLRRNPAAGCDDGEYSAAKLYLDTTKVMGIINPLSRDVLASFGEYCRGAQNEVVEDDSEDYSTLSRVCNDNGNDWSKTKNALIDTTVDSVEDQNRELAKKYLTAADRDDKKIRELDSKTIRKLNDVRESIASANKDYFQELVQSNLSKYETVGEMIKQNPDIRAKLQLQGTWDDSWNDNTKLDIKILEVLSDKLEDEYKIQIFKARPEDTAKIFRLLKRKDGEVFKAMLDYKDTGDNIDMCTQHTMIATLKSAVEAVSDSNQKEYSNILSDQVNEIQIPKIDNSIARITSENNDRTYQYLGELIEEAGPCAASQLGEQRSPKQSNPIAETMKQATELLKGTGSGR